MTEYQAHQDRIPVGRRVILVIGGLCVRIRSLDRNIPGKLIAQICAELEKFLVDPVGGSAVTIRVAQAIYQGC